MRSIKALAFFLILAWASTAYASDDYEAISRSMSDLPRPGSLADVLTCSGTNQIYWRYLRGDNPGSEEADAAQRKASWYAAVALWVFAVKPDAIHDAIASAGDRPLSETIELANQCRLPPGDWQHTPGWAIDTR